VTQQQVVRDQLVAGEQADATLRRVSYVPVPRELLGEAVARVDDLLELKVVLVALRMLAQRRPGGRWLLPGELLLDPSLARALAEDDPDTRARQVEAALSSACGRGILVCGFRTGGGEESRIALNTARDRAALEAAGWAIRPARVVVRGEPGARPRSNIFELYEQNIGMVTPLLAEELGEAEKVYPPDWIQDAFREAVGYNRRSWRYVRTILENWVAEGRGSGGAAGRRAEAARNRRRNRSGRY
jgi:DnaD/phage-associated family protein